MQRKTKNLIKLAGAVSAVSLGVGLTFASIAGAQQPAKRPAPVPPTVVTDPIGAGAVPPDVEDDSYLLKPTEAAVVPDVQIDPTRAGAVPPGVQDDGYLLKPATVEAERPVGVDDTSSTMPAPDPSGVQIDPTSAGAVPPEVEDDGYLVVPPTPAPAAQPSR